MQRLNPYLATIQVALLSFASKRNGSVSKCIVHWRQGPATPAPSWKVSAATAAAAPVLLPQKSRMLEKRRGGVVYGHSRLNAGSFHESRSIFLFFFASPVSESTRLQSQHSLLQPCRQWMLCCYCGYIFVFSSGFLDKWVYFRFGIWLLRFYLILFYVIPVLTRYIRSHEPW